MTDTATTRQAERLRQLVEPAHTAVLTMELQRGVVGAEGLLPALVEQVKRAGTLAVAGRVCAAARDVGVRVVHCTAESRPDGAGSAQNCKIFALGARRRREGGSSPTEVGSTGAGLVPELGEDPRDIVVPRLHGMSPFTSTSLDQILRNLGITTVVAMGVSVNLGVFGLAMSALDLGYQVILVRDGVVGIPVEYADAVIENSLSLISTVVTSDELLAAWVS
ncbi:MAG TPA: cysteine hydrolase [Acidimicrobiales bacterium]|nr:cysteine hydrolase [Acidimicrobiales bacterium]